MTKQTKKIAETVQDVTINKESVSVILSNSAESQLLALSTISNDTEVKCLNLGLQLKQNGLTPKLFKIVVKKLGSSLSTTISDNISTILKCNDFITNKLVELKPSLSNNVVIKSLIASIKSLDCDNKNGSIVFNNDKFMAIPTAEFSALVKAKKETDIINSYDKKLAAFTAKGILSNIAHEIIFASMSDNSKNIISFHLSKNNDKVATSEL